MARKRFQLIYPDGSKKHIGTTIRDKHLAALEIQRINDTTFLFIGNIKPRIMHSFTELHYFVEEPPNSLLGPKFQAGYFLRDFRGKRTRELFETPTGMVCRLQAEGML